MDTEYAYWYALAFHSGLSGREVNRLWENWSSSGQRSLAALFEMAAEDSPSLFSAEQRLALENARGSLPDARKVLEACEEQSIRPVTLADDEYPAALRKSLEERCPPMMFSCGALEILERPGIGIIGSRDASPEGLEFAAGAAAAFAAEGWNVVSGLAKGIDRAAMGAALEAGGVVTAVLPYGILSRPGDLISMGEHIEQEQLVVLSQFQPMAPWHVGFAMARNAVVTGLSRAIIAADAGESGGTAEASRSALERGRAVFVRPFAEGSSPGLAALVAAGASVLEYDPDCPGEMIEKVLGETEGNRKTKGMSSPPRQGRLF